jgi:DNA-binding NarL/FixJ family response regulator
LTSPDPVKVVVADDQSLVRAGFRVLIDSAEDLEVIGEAADGAEAVAVVRDKLPDVVLMDVRMPDTDGIEATRQITQGPWSEAEQPRLSTQEGDRGADESAEAARRPPRIIMLTTFDLDEYVYEALHAGASGFLLKDTPPSDLLAAIRIVAAGDALLAPSVTRRLIAEFAARHGAGHLTHGNELSSLTDREAEVLVEVARGRSNAEIAGELHMSVATAKTHVSRLLAKLAARDRAQLVMIAYETGLVQPG